jgi:gamma-glutamyltranspeptidase/glutathione hydrolase
MMTAMILGLWSWGALGQWDKPARADNYMVASGHVLATEAGLIILRQGGNAFDAGVATAMALNVTRPMSAGMMGVAPTLLYEARTGQVHSYNGLGTAPGRMTVQYLRGQGWPVAPFFGINAQLIPASPDAWIAVLEKYGSMSFSEVAAPAIKLAEEGHVLNKTTANFMKISWAEMALMKYKWPYNYSVFWKPFEPSGPAPGKILYQKDLAKTLRLMADAEQRELQNSGDRLKALEAARAVFYKGEVAEAIAKLHRDFDGPMTREELEWYHGQWESPVSGNYKGYTIYANDAWCQGPTVPMVLQMLENLDLKSLGHNTPEYISAVAQAIELAYADREAYFGDPQFVDVPIHGLLSREYAKERGKLINPKRGFGKMPSPGDPWKYEGRPRPKNIYQPRPIPASLPPHRASHDTTYLCVVDKSGNAFSLTPSDFPYSPMVPGYGIMLGNRVQQFRLKDGHPAQVAPHKRPRLTPNPSMVTKDGKLFMAFGTPGGDMQPQAMVQVFLNIVEWGMDPQAAINAPRFKSKNFPDSFSPHFYYPGKIQLEDEIKDRAAALAQMNFKVEILPQGTVTTGAVCAIIRDEKGHLLGGADPREEAIAQGE